MTVVAMKRKKSVFTNPKAVFAKKWEHILSKIKPPKRRKNLFVRKILEKE